jgi:tetratricopeptide (TPR) repeat protein
MSLVGLKTTIAITAGVAAAAAGAWLLLAPDREAPAQAQAANVSPPAANLAGVPTLAAPAPGRAAPARPPVEPLRPQQLAELGSPLQTLASSLFEQLKGGPTAAACEGAQGGLLQLLGQTPVNSAAWNWGMNRARDCLRAPTAFRANNKLLAGLIDRYPDHPRVKELAGLQQYDAGDMDAAVEALEEAAEEANTFEAWVSYADAQLARMQALRAQGDPAWQDALARAESAAFRALELANVAMRPFAMHTIARTQLEAGRWPEAVQWADQAVQAVQAAGSNYQAYMAAELYVFAGQIYYRAGQRDTGLAYMDQGISMAARADQQADLRRIRDEFLQMYGSA